jgi:protein tyrosine/serine phosphatase
MKPRRTVLTLLVTLSCGACSSLNTVEEGRVYRSSQPDEDMLARWIHHHGLKTVVCLRGDGDGSGRSRRPSEAAGITFVNLAMSARRRPSAETLLALWELFENAEYPLLVHCRAGADRTGLAAALYVLWRTGDLDAARDQLALVPYLHWSAREMDQVLVEYAPFHGQLAFPDWVRQYWRRE